MNKELLKQLMFTSGVSGREGNIANLITDKISPYVDEIKIDKVGNLIAHKKGNGKKVLFMANMDTIGFYADYIKSNGHITVSSVRGLGYENIANSEVVSQNGVSGIVVCEDTEEKVSYETVYIDIKTENKEETEKSVKVTDTFTFKPKLRKIEDTKYVGNPFDNRIGCYTLIEVIKNIKNQKCDLYFAFTTQGEDEHYGSRNVAYQVKPDYVISVSIANTKNSSVKVGEGVCIKIKDTRTICSQDIIDLIRNTAKENNIKFQYEFDEKSGYDLSLVRTVGEGCYVGAVSIPCENNHSNNEIIDFNDVENAVSLIKEIAEVVK